MISILIFIAFTVGFYLISSEGNLMPLNLLADRKFWGSAILGALFTWA